MPRFQTIHAQTITFYNRKFTIMWPTFELRTIVLQCVFLIFADDTMGNRGLPIGNNVVTVFLEWFSILGVHLVLLIVFSEAPVCRSINSNRSRKWGTSVKVLVCFCYSKRVPESRITEVMKRLRGSHSASSRAHKCCGRVSWRCCSSFSLPSLGERVSRITLTWLRWMRHGRSKLAFRHSMALAYNP